jgi:hypothetical protein
MTTVRPLVQFDVAARRRDVRRLVTCPHPIRSHQSAIYIVAEAQVVRECSDGDTALIGLVTNHPREAHPPMG